MVRKRKDKICVDLDFLVNLGRLLQNLSEELDRGNPPTRIVRHTPGYVPPPHREPSEQEIRLRVANRNAQDIAIEGLRRMRELYERPTEEINVIIVGEVEACNG